MLSQDDWVLTLLLLEYGFGVLPEDSWETLVGWVLTLLLLEYGFGELWMVGL